MANINIFELANNIISGAKIVPELENLKGVQQNSLYHPEGDAYQHTMLVIKEALKVADVAQNPEGFILSAICHDFGKAEKTTFNEEKGTYTSYGHDKASVPLADAFLKREGLESFSAYVENMCELHMQPTPLFQQGAKEKSTNKLFSKSVCPSDLILLARCDHYGRGEVKEGSYEETEAFLRERLEIFKSL